MPDDGGFKFMLVCVDSANSATDAIPMKEITQNSVIEAFKKVFAGKYLKQPTYMQVDAGKEFTGETLKYLNDLKIMVKVSKVARSRQISYAESTNKHLARALFTRMAGQELLTDKIETGWIADLPYALEAINENAKSIFAKKKKKVAKDKKPIFTNENINLLQLGTRVRIILDKPKGITKGDRLSGAFRATDTKWSTEIYTIGNIILNDGQPPLYLVKIDKKFIPAGYTLNQLQVVGEIEAPKAKEVLRGEPESYVIEKIKNMKNVCLLNVTLVRIR